jgi:hypothetical protein
MKSSAAAAAAALAIVFHYYHLLLCNRTTSGECRKIIRTAKMRIRMKFICLKAYLSFILALFLCTRQDEIRTNDFN